jgi:hypothetical protein
MDQVRAGGLAGATISDCRAPSPRLSARQQLAAHPSNLKRCRRHSFTTGAVPSGPRHGEIKQQQLVRQLLLQWLRFTQQWVF